MSDIFTWRCAKGSWRTDGTCDYCGGLRPSLALERIKTERWSITPTDKNYKLYIGGSTKVYTNHFSQDQAVELISLVEKGEAKLEYPGRFYSGLAFKDYADAIEAATAAIRATRPLSAPTPATTGAADVPRRDVIHRAVAVLVADVIRRHGNGETIMGMHEADTFCERYIDGLNL